MTLRARRQDGLSKTHLLLLLPVLTVAAGSFALDFFTPAMGDDLSKWANLGLDEYTHPDHATLKFIKGQYFGCNGRLLDALGPAFINLLPRFVASLVMAFMAAFYFKMIAVCSDTWRRGRVTATWLVTLATLAAMPWWDYMLLRVCQFNYLWATVFCLLFIHTYYYDSGKKILWLLFTGFMAGACHEQSGVAMGAVFAVVAVKEWRNHTLDGRRLWLLAALFAGALFTVASPAIHHRAEEQATDATFIHQLVVTLPLLLLLLAIIVVACISRAGRSRLRSLATTPWAVYVAVAVAGGLISVYSTIPGRTGWLSESMALVAIVLLIPGRDRMLTRRVAVAASTAMAIVVAAHYAVAASWQQRMGREYDEVVELFKVSPTGTVYCDITLDNSVPVIALNRVKGVPDADDMYLHLVISQAYGADKRLVVVPTAFAGGLPAGTDSIACGRYTLYRHRPATTAYTDCTHSLIEVTGDGRVLTTFVDNDSTTLHLASPLVIDPGDTWHICDQHQPQ